MRKFDHVQYKKLLATIFLILNFGMAFSQEVTDSTKIHQFRKYGSNGDVEIYFEQQFAKEFPFAGNYNTEFQKLNQVFNTKKLELNVYTLYQATEGCIYYYHKGGYYFGQNTNPLSMNMHYSLGEELGWDKLDIYFDANAQLVNRYNVAEFEKLMNPDGQRMMMWNGAIGASYEVKPNVYLFMESRGFFIGKKHGGQIHKGGVKVKF